MVVGYRATCSSRPYSVPSGFRKKISCKTTVFSSSHSSIKNKTWPWIREKFSPLIINLYTNYGHCFKLVALAAIGLGSWIASLSVPQNPPVPGVTQHLQENRNDVVTQRVWHFLLLIWSSESVSTVSPQGPGSSSASMCGKDNTGIQTIQWVLISGGIERLASCAVYSLYLIIEIDHMSWSLILPWATNTSKSFRFGYHIWPPWNIYNFKSLYRLTVDTKCIIESVSCQQHAVGIGSTVTSFIRILWPIVVYFICKIFISYNMYSFHKTNWL